MVKIHDAIRDNVQYEWVFIIRLTYRYSRKINVSNNCHRYSLTVMNVSIKKRYYILLILSKKKEFTEKKEGNGLYSALENVGTFIVVRTIAIERVLVVETSRALHICQEESETCACIRKIQVLIRLQRTNECMNE